MAYFPETISESEFVLCPEPDLAEYANIYCDKFEDVSPPITVETAVTRGKKLRECKPSVQLHHEYRVGIDYVKPCAEKKRSHRKCYQRPCFDIYNSPCIPTHSPPCGCCPSASSVRCKTYKRSQTSLPHHRQCPLRIMELATPTKRHCLDTWRSKSHILPDYMLDRIRQHVMDERPVVQIPEALNCFKKRVSNRSSKCSKFKASDACMSDMRQYSAIFAHCIAQKLNKPLNITLNPELEKISRIVSYEISRVTSKTGHIKKKKNQFERQIQDEMSKKVTAWIDTVLEDTSGKLLQDDLRELEEEEGPVLDIIDDLIDNFVASREPEEENTKYTAGDITDDETAPDRSSDDIETTQDGQSEGIEGYVTQEFNKEIDNMISKKVDDLTTDNLDSQSKNSKTEATENLNVTMADILNEDSVTDNVGQVIDSITGTATADLYAGHENISDGTSAHTVNGNTNILTDKEVIDTDTELENIKQNLPSNKASEYVFEDDSDKESQDQQGRVDGNGEKSDDRDENDPENDDETGGTTNVSALYTNSGESLDGNNKTVKFSKVDDDIGMIDAFLLENQKSPRFENEEKDRPKTFSHENNILFATPNESLLRKVDETWPNDISLGGPKLSANVSKSVVSMGLITENLDEEKQAIQSSQISVGVMAPYADKLGDKTVIDNAIDVLQKRGEEVKGKIISQGEETNIQENKNLEPHVSQKVTTDHIAYIKTAVLEQPTLTVNIKTDNNIHEVGSPTLLTEQMRHLKNELILSVHTFDVFDKEKDKDFNELGSPMSTTQEHKHFKKETIESVPTFNYKLEKDKIVNGFGSPTFITDKIKHSKEGMIQSVQAFDDITENIVLPNKKVNYKVESKTAPSWVLSGFYDKGRGEPEDSFSKHKHKNKYEINEGDVRILAKNLEIISANLLIWNDWIDTTCRNIKHRKRKSGRNIRKSSRTNTKCPNDIDYWIKLEKYISKDAHFWLKLKHSSKKRLKTYQYIYRTKQALHAGTCDVTVTDRARSAVGTHRAIIRLSDGDAVRRYINNLLK